MASSSQAASSVVEPSEQTKQLAERKKRVLERLAQLVGRRRVDDVCGCVKRAALAGFIDLEKPDDALAQVVCDGECEACGQKMKARLRDCIFQDNNGGMYYEERGGPVRCPSKGCNFGMFVTRLCVGAPMLNGGKAHNHCSDCEHFGVCIGDYRERHCDECGQHYYRDVGCYCQGLDADGLWPID